MINWKDYSREQPLDGQWCLILVERGTWVSDCVPGDDTAYRIGEHCVCVGQYQGPRTEEDINQWYQDMAAYYNVSVSEARDNFDHEDDEEMFEKCWQQFGADCYDEDEVRWWAPIDKLPLPRVKDTEVD